MTSLTPPIAHNPSPRSYRIDKNTAPGIFITLVTIIMLILTAVFFDEEQIERDAIANGTGSPRRRKGGSKAGSPRGSEGKQQALEQALELAEQGQLSPARDTDADGDTKPVPPSKVALVTCIWVFFVHFYSFALQETITTPLVPALYGWTQQNVDILFVGSGVITLVTSFALRYISRVVGDRPLLIISMVLGLVGCLLLVDYPGYPRNTLPLPSFLVGFAFITVAFPFGRNVTLSLYSQVSSWAVCVCVCVYGKWGGRMGGEGPSGWEGGIE